MKGHASSLKLPGLRPVAGQVANVSRKTSPDGSLRVVRTARLSHAFATSRRSRSTTGDPRARRNSQL
ncbi:hypothetical protein FM111_00125 [Brevundimonas diminuta 3F5N]|uniref:Uncharacterized protein n=1 Tax=Brevundimonas diminuta 3F5N TaxID=1255603 RepID=A0A1R4EPD8_BREDI|nr:hypothetical protein FM111_00125 [Brevundimonas diminuta 3F5N]